MSVDLPAVAPPAGRRLGGGPARSGGLARAQPRVWIPRVGRSGAASAVMAAASRSTLRRARTVSDRASVPTVANTSSRGVLRSSQAISLRMSGRDGSPTSAA